MHVVVAYGYARFDNKEGFLVHYGWGDTAVEVWVPEELFGFKIRMSVEHTHTLTDTGNVINSTHRELVCNECGYSTVEHIYEITNSNIIRTKYSLSGFVLIPTRIELYSPATASFSTVSISKIGLSAFENQTEITKVSLPAGITQIGDNAFAGCTSLTDINIREDVTSIGKNAFV